MKQSNNGQPFSKKQLKSMRSYGDRQSIRNTNAKAKTKKISVSAKGLIAAAKAAAAAATKG